MSNLVVKSNRLNSAIQNLSKVEIRMIQIAIVDARESGLGLSADSPLTITAGRFAEVFGCSRENAYARMREAEETLFNRRFSFINESGRVVKSRWISQVVYIDGEGSIQMYFTPAVVNEITRLDGTEKDQVFTQYFIENTRDFKSGYAVRLYELLTQWRSAKKTPVFKLEEFRGQLGLDDEYKVMSDFKKRVLEPAIKEINKKSDLKISYEQEKNGRKIVGFKFKIEEKKQKKNKDENRDLDTVDMFNGMTEKQIDYFSKKLANDSEFQSVFVAPIGSSMSEYEQSIKTKLQDEKYQNEWSQYLKNLGFKQ